MEIGGFIGLECNGLSPYHEHYLSFNSCNNALKYYLLKKKVKTIYLPYYTCPSVWNAVTDCGCRIIPYEVSDKFYPTDNLNPKSAYIVFNNYFGICDEIIEELTEKYNNVIVDNAQAFYSQLIGNAAIYSPRKFFGVPDGGLLISDLKENSDLPISYSYTEFDHLLKRVDLSSDEAYPDYRKNEELIGTFTMKKMSKLTESMLNSIDYANIKQRRISNFNYLNKKLSSINKEKVRLAKQSVPMVYPFYTEYSELRKKLISKKIYVAKYWAADGLSKCMTTIQSTSLANNIVPLPIDQRYSEKDMDYIVEVIGELIN